LLANNTNTNTIIQIVHSAGNLFLILERRLVPDFLKEDFLLSHSFNSRFGVF